jgi:hypothetical protein
MCECISRVFLTIINLFYRCLQWIFCCSRKDTKHAYKPVKIISLGNYRSHFFYIPTGGNDDEEVKFLVRTFSNRSTHSAPALGVDDHEGRLDLHLFENTKPTTKL